MLPSEGLAGYAGMLKLPRTAKSASRRRQPPNHPPQQSEDESSPTEVLRGPLAPSARTRRHRRPPITAPEGHAQDIVHLLQAGWFGPLDREKAAALFTPPAPEDDPPPPSPRARRGRQQQQQQRRDAGDRASDASPSTSSQRSGSSQQLAVPGGSTAATVPSRGLPMGSSRQQQQQAAVQDLPGIGTWAGRYRLFGRQQPPEEQPAGPAMRPPSADQLSSSAAQEQATAAAEAVDQFGSPVVLRPGGFGLLAADGRGEQRTQYGSEQAQEEAWRWRFSRKWATEQKRYYDAPEQPASVVSDDLDAMEFTQACGMGLNLQVMPTSRQLHKAAAASADEDGVLGLENSASTLSLCQFDVDQSVTTMGLLSAEVSPGNSTHGAIAAGRLLCRTGSGSGAPRQHRQQGQQAAAGQGAPSPRLPSATRSVLSLANKAQELLKKQGAIEQEVQDRWERGCTAGDAWAGRSLRAVHIDMWGRFKYCVLRVSDGAGHTRFLVRGRAGATPAALLEAVSQEAAEASRSRGLPAAIVEVVGAGIMEWREDTERELHLTPSMLPPADVGRDTQYGATSDSPTKAGYLGDVSGLTASLVRQALPCHFRITTASASRASSMSALANRV